MKDEDIIKMVGQSEKAREEAEHGLKTFSCRWLVVIGIFATLAMIAILGR